MNRPIKQRNCQCNFKIISKSTFLKKTYVEIRKMANYYWDFLNRDIEVPLFCKSPLTCLNLSIADRTISIFQYLNTKLVKQVIISFISDNLKLIWKKCFVYFESSKTSNLKLFTKKVIDLKPKAIFAKCSTLDIWNDPK